MVDEGILEEVDLLLGANLPEGSTALQAIGYNEFFPYRRGEATLEEAVEELKLRSRQYAKRQLTWLRRNKDIHWIYWEKERDFDKALQEATEILAPLGLG
jgi:tRNA dimethylallyltransferase